MFKKKQEHNDGASSTPETAQTLNREDEDRMLRENLSRIKNKILVLSGKGGVGKSTVAVNIAAALAEKGLKVGLLDVDIHGPSIPKLVGLEGSRLMASVSGMLLPLETANGLKVMSIGFLLETSDTAVIWRGPLKYGVIKQFLKDVATSLRNCLMTPYLRGPRQMTAVSLVSSRKPIDMTLRPFAVSRGNSMPDTLAMRREPSSPTSFGMLGPWMSTSSRPTLSPFSAKAAAMLTATVLFPTPPFPERTRILFLMRLKFSLSMRSSSSLLSVCAVSGVDEAPSLCSCFFLNIVFTNGLRRWHFRAS